MTINIAKKARVVALFSVALAATALLGAKLTTSAHAQTQAPVPIEQFRAWTAYSHVDSDTGKKGCFVASQPQSYDPADVDRHGDVLFFITRRPADNVSGETSLAVGYEFRAESDVSISVDGQEFNMFTNGKGAWTKTSDQDGPLIDAMKAGSKMIVSGVSRRDTKTRYEFSLSGVTAALNRIAKECK